jgi:transcriptional regulator with XRE-family HTH domain
MNTTPRQFGMTLRALRTAKTLTQAALAERAGYGREYVNKLEAGRYDVPLSTLVKLAAALGVRPARLLR